MRTLALKILQEETDGFESQSRLRDDVLDAMLRFEKEANQSPDDDQVGQAFDSMMGNPMNQLDDITINKRG